VPGQPGVHSDAPRPRRPGGPLGQDGAGLPRSPRRRPHGTPRARHSPRVATVPASKSRQSPRPRASNRTLLSPAASSRASSRSPLLRAMGAGPRARSPRRLLALPQLPGLSLDSPSSRPAGLLPGRLGAASRAPPPPPPPPPPRRAAPTRQVRARSRPTRPDPARSAPAPRSLRGEAAARAPAWRRPRPRPARGPGVRSPCRGLGPSPGRSRGRRFHTFLAAEEAASRGGPGEPRTFPDARPQPYMGSPGPLSPARLETTGRPPRPRPGCPWTGHLGAVPQSP
jgi:hypothetical protein